MTRHLHMFEGIVARFGEVTTDRRMIMLPNRMRSTRVIRSRDLPLPVHQQTAGRAMGFEPPLCVGFVCALHEAESGQALAASGILDLNMLDPQSRDALLAGERISAGVDLDEVTAEHANGSHPYPDVMYMNDWRVSGVQAGGDHISPWRTTTYIQLQTGYYADLTKLGMDT